MSMNRKDALALAYERLLEVSDIPMTPNGPLSDGGPLVDERQMVLEAIEDETLGLAMIIDRLQGAEAVLEWAKHFCAPGNGGKVRAAIDAAIGAYDLLEAVE
jgi:hypothetical protein